jgi:hypothetical protein
MRYAAALCACLALACGAPRPSGEDGGDAGADGSPQACASNLDCLFDEACVFGFCQPRIADGGPCRGHGDCTEAGKPYCSGGACVECLSEVDCGLDKTCVQSACVPRSDAGAGDTGPAGDAGPDGDAGAAGDAGPAGDAGADGAADAGADAGDGDAGTEDAEGRACTGQGTCPIGYACTPQRDGGAFCRRPCDPYQPSCAADRRCEWTFMSGGAPAGACVPPQGGHTLGEACALDDLCAVDLVCVRDDAAGSHCRTLCNYAQGAQAGGCAAPNACQAVPLGDGLFIGLCFPDTTFLDACGHNSECGQGLTCSVGSFPADPYAFHNQCAWTEGAQSTAAACTAPEQCDTGICLQLWQSCYGACRTEADCSDAQRPTACLDIGFQQQSPAGPVTSALPSCVPECQSDVACGNGVCGVFLNHEADDFTAVCVPREIGAGPAGAGARCDADSDCLSLACFTGGAPATDGFCLGACSQPADCLHDTACPADGVMLSIGNGEFAPAPICWGKPCAVDADCANQSLDPARQRVCTAFINPNDSADDIVLACFPRYGTKRGGEACGTSDECASGWCVNFGSAGQRCFGGCATATDCLGGAQCQSFNWASGPQCSSNTQCAATDQCLSGFCQTPCSTDAECPRPQICTGNVCRHIVQMCAP